MEERGDIDSANFIGKRPQMARGKPWTNDDMAQLASLMAQGEPASVIAAKLGRTPYAVLSRAAQFGLIFAPGQREKRPARSASASTRFGRVF